MFILGNYDSALLFVVIQLLFSLSLFCNRYSLFKTAKFLTLISTNYSVLILSFTFGHSSGFYLYYFTSPLIVYSFFHFYQFRQTVISLLLYLSSYALIEYANYNKYEAFVAVEPSTLTALYYLNVTMAFCFLIILTSSFSKFQNDVATEVNLKNIELRQKQLELEKILDEKNTLLSETHHRVKNNLAVISGLFDLQLMYDDDAKLKSILTNAKNRIKSMSLVHESLYQEADIASIDMQKYLSSLVSEIVKTMQKDTIIDIQYDIDYVSLNLSKAIPLGLIVNEVVSNCFKHAFDNHPTGKIVISLKKNNSCQLVIKDNGNGIPLNKAENSNSLGMVLIEAFSKQVDGNYTYRINNGTEFSLNFDCSLDL